MGRGIALVFASAGFSVKLFEPDTRVREGIRARLAADVRSFDGDEAAVERVDVTGNLREAVTGADFVTEAAPERLDLKRSIFAELEAIAPATAILASNTSVLPIGEIAAGRAGAERIIGTHWWNPPGLVPLVEVVPSRYTSQATVARTMELLRSVGKAPAEIARDVPGFVANRLQHALWREAIAMVAQGICDSRTLDDCVKNSFGLRLAVLGPLENADLVGLDLTLDIHRALLPDLDRSPGPNPYLEAQVAAGRLGFKSGAGFRPWTSEEMAEVRQRLAAHLLEAKRKSASA